MIKTNIIISLIDNVDMRNLEIKKCKTLVKEVRTHLKIEMESICDSVNYLCATPKMSAIENQKLYNYLLTRLMDLWATLVVFEEMLEKAPDKIRDRASQTMLGNVLKIYNNSTVDIENGKIISLPTNLAVVFRKTHSKEDAQYYDLLTQNKKILTIVF